MNGKATSGGLPSSVHCSGGGPTESSPLASISIAENQMCLVGSGLETARSTLMLAGVEACTTDDWLQAIAQQK